MYNLGNNEYAVVFPFWTNFVLVSSCTIRAQSNYFLSFSSINKSLNLLRCSRPHRARWLGQEDIQDRALWLQKAHPNSTKKLYHQVGVPCYYLGHTSVIFTCAAFSFSLSLQTIVLWRVFSKRICSTSPSLGCSA